MSKNPFKVFDQVTATDASIQAAHSHGFGVAPTDVVTVLGFKGDNLILSDGSDFWHYSHFKKIGEHAAGETVIEELEKVNPELAFNEFTILDELREYITKTYGEHYAKDGVQAFALIAKRPLRDLHFALSSIIKYSDRFGEKEGMNRKDLLKVAHFSVLAIYCFDCLEDTKRESN